MLLAGVVAHTFDHHSGMLRYGLPLGLNELFRGCCYEGSTARSPTRASNWMAARP